MKKEYIESSIDHGSVVLIDGGAGFVGSNLAKELLKKDCEVFAVDNLITGRVSNIASLISNRSSIS